MKKLIFMALFFGIVGLPSFAAADNITIVSGKCQTLLLFNNTNNSAYNQTVCGGWYQFNISRTLDYNEIFNDSNINLTLTAPSNTSAKCFIRANISGRLESKGGNCDVDVGIDNLTNYITNFTLEVEPKEKENIKIENNTNFCSLNLTVKGYPEQFRLPANSTIIPQAQYDLFSKNLEKGLSVVEQAMKCTQDLADEKMKTVFFNSQLSDAKSRTCAISDSMLLRGWKQLTPDDIDYLNYFVKTDAPVTSLAFAKAIKSGKNTTKEEFQSTWFYAEQSLKKYNEIGFAEITEKSYWSPTLNSNTSDYYFRPLVNEYCLNKTSQLLSIESQSYQSGMSGTTIIFGLIISSILGILYLNARRGVVPKF